MIDFRYHLVSLISVFLALAVGIVLGAGPLQNSIGSTLTEQVNQLRTDKEDLRTQLSTANTAVTHRDQFAEAITPALVGSSLSGRTVAIVTLPGVEDDAADALKDAVATAGGSVTGRIKITDNWTAADKEADRTGALSNLTKDLPGGYVPADGTSPERLAQVLATSVVSSVGTTLSGAGSTDAATALKDLSTAGLINVDDKLSGLATGVLFVVPANPEATGQAPATPAVSADAAADYVNLAAKLDATGSGTVATGPASAASDGLISSIRDDDTVSKDVSTVDDGSTAMGVATAVLALSEQLAGGNGSYGFGSGVDAIMPPIAASSAASTSTGTGTGKTDSK